MKRTFNGLIQDEHNVAFGVAYNLFSWPDSNVSLHIKNKVTADSPDLTLNVLSFILLRPLSSVTDHR